MSYFLGIDAGATKTQCAVAQDADVLARVQGGSIQIRRVGEEAARENLRAMLATLVRQCGVQLQSVTGTCVGLSGNAIVSVADWVRIALAARVGGPIVIRGDEEIALDAAFHGGRGILAIAGTGSHIMGRTCAGEIFRTGGWGPVLSDQGAGSRIGLLAVRAIFHSIDAGEQTSLLPAVHAAWGTRTLDELIDLGNRMPGPDFSRLAPIVADCAKNGDPSARRVLQQSGEEIADLLLLAMRKGSALEARGEGSDFPTPSESRPEPWTVAYTGSVIEKIFALRESMIAAVLCEQPSAMFQSQATDPLLGALWRARQDAPIP
ncbi:MAG: BadF/BadG/BcrA/BcrD ATPase family protein [Acidobacteriaceae bacterium]